MTVNYPVFLEISLVHARATRQHAAEEAGVPWKPQSLGEVWRDTIRMNMKLDDMFRGELRQPSEAEVEAEASRLLALTEERFRDEVGI